jgi:hypothetical protein
MIRSARPAKIKGGFIMENLLAILVICVFVLLVMILILEYTINKNGKLFNKQYEALDEYISRIVPVLSIDSADKLLDHVYHMHHHQPMDAKTGKVIKKIKNND